MALPLDSWAAGLAASLLAGLLALLVLAPLRSPVGTDPQADPGAPDAAREALAQLPLQFERNDGQVDRQVRFLEHRGSHATYLTDSAVITSLRQPRSGQGATIRMAFVGARRHSTVTGVGELPGKVNYLRGHGRDVTGIDTYRRIRYERLWPGIDALFYGREGRLEYDYVVSPGSDPGRIQVRFSGARPRLARNGDLLLPTAGGTIRELAPVTYQRDGARREPVRSRYELGRAGRVRIAVGRYDRSRPLVIDPVLSYATYIGGSGTDAVEDVAIDSSGNAYVVGGAASGFPTTTGAYDTEQNGGTDVFVSKLAAGGTSLSWSTFIGGSASDTAYDVELASGNAPVITGDTFDGTTDFPTTSGAYDTSHDGSADAFVAKLAADGASLTWSTLFGGSGLDRAYGLVLDSSDNPHIAGHSGSTGLASTGQTTHGGGDNDAFVAKFSSNGDTRTWSTYVGGSSADYGYDLALDSSANVFLTGYAQGSLPNTTNTYDSSHNGGNDGFVAKISSSGSPSWATFLGGSNGDVLNGVTVDSAGRPVVAGYTEGGFPTTSGSYDTSDNGGLDIVVAKLAADGASLSFSTLIGGNSTDLASDLALTSAGSVYLTGRSASSSGFPVVKGFDSTAPTSGNQKAYLAKLSSSGTAIPWSTYVTGHGTSANALARGSDGALYLGGTASGTTLGATTGAYQTSNGGGGDGFVARVLDAPSSVRPSVTTENVSFGTAISSSGGSTGINAGVHDVAVDDSGNLWVAEYANDRIVKFDSSGTQQSTIGVTACSSTTEDTYGIAYMDSKLYLADQCADKVRRFSTSGTEEASWTLNNAFDVAGRDGYVYAISAADNTVRKYDPDGGLETSWESNVSTPRGIEVDRVGDVYVSNRGTGNVRRFDSTGSLEATPITGLSNNYGVGVDPGGNIWVVESGTSSIKKYSSSGSALKTVTASGTSLSQPRGLGVDSSGVAYAADHHNGRVMRTNTISSASYTEDGSATAVDSALDVADLDSSDLTGATVSITNFQSGEDVLSFTNQNGISGSFNATMGVMTLSGTASVANYQTALRSVTYSNSSNTPTTTARTFSIAASDTTGAGAGYSRSMSVTAANDAPVVTTSGGSAGYTEDGAPTAVDSGLTVTDSDSANLSSATAQVTTNRQSSEDVLEFTPQSGVTSSWDASTGTLTFTGSASPSTYQTLLRSVAYRNASNSPTTSTRTVSFKVNDGSVDSSAATRSVGITAAADAPNLVPGTSGGFVSGWGSSGSSSGQFNGVRTMAADSSGNVYVADAGNNRVQKFSSSGTHLVNFSGFSGDVEGVAVDPVGNVYISDHGSDSVSKYSSGGSLLATFGSFTNPVGVAVDANGNVYVADPSAAKVWKYTHAGNLQTSFTNFVTDALRGVAVDSAGNVYTAEAGSTDRVRKWSSSGTLLSTIASSGSTDGAVSDPYGLAVDAFGSLYVSDAGNDRIQKFNSSGSFVSKFGSSGSGDGAFNLPLGVAVGSGGTVFVGDATNSRIQKFGATTLLHTENDAATAIDSGLTITDSDSSNLASATVSISTNFASSEDALAFTDQNGITGSYESSTGVMTLSGSATIANYETALRSVKYRNASDTPSSSTRTVTFSASDGSASGSTTRPVSVTAANDAPLLVPGTAGSFQTKWGTQGTGNGQFSGPWAVDVDRSTGNVYVADAENDRIQEFDAGGTFVTKWGTTGSGDTNLNDPSGIAVAPSGDVYVADTSNNRVVQFDSSGNFIRKWGSSGSGNGQFNSPVGVTVDQLGNVYVADKSNHRIQKFSSTGTYLTRWGSNGSSDGQFSSPIDIAVDPTSTTGDVYVADALNNRIQEFTSTGSFVRKWGQSGTADGDTKEPQGVATDLAGNVYVVETFGHRVSKFSSTGTFLTKFGSEGTSDGQLTHPRAAAVDASGRVYVADRNNQRIQRFGPTALAYTENDPATVVDGALSVTDPDNSNLASAAVTLTNPKTGDELSYSTTNGVSGTVNAAKDTVTFSSSASASNLQAALRAVKFQNSSDNPDTTDRSVTFKVNDGSVDSNATTRTIALTATNDAPSLATTGSNVAYTENDAATAVDPGLTVSDLDNANLSSATVSITGNFSSSEDTLSLSNQNGITGSYNSTTGVMTLSGSASVANYQTALRSVKYRNKSDNPSTLTRTISFKANDGSADSSSATRSVSVTATADKPILATSSYSGASNWGAPGSTEGVRGSQPFGIAFDASSNVLVAYRGDSGSSIQGKIDKFSPAGTRASGFPVNFTDAEDVGVDSSGNLWVLRDNGGSANLQKLSSSGASTGTSITTGASSRGIFVDSSDNVWVANGSAATVTKYSSNGTALGTQASGIGGAGAWDVAVAPSGDFYVTSEGSPSGNNFVYRFASDGTLLRQWGTTGSSSGQLKSTRGIWVDSRGLVYVGEACCNHRVTVFDPTGDFVTTIAEPAGGDPWAVGVDSSRNVYLGYTEGTADHVSKQSVAPIAYSEGGAATAVDSGLLTVDVDSTNLTGATVQITANYQSGSDVLSYTAPGGNPVTGAFAAGSGTMTFSGSATKAQYQEALRAVKYSNSSDDPGSLTRTVSFKANDGSADSSAITRDISVSAVNDAPTVATSGTGLAYTENDAATVVDPGVVVADADDASLESAQVQITNAKDGDELSYATTNGVNGSVNAARDTVTLTGSGAKADYQAALRAVKFRNTSDAPDTTARSVSFKVNDGDADSSAATRTIALTATNDAPTVTATGTNLAYTENDAATVVDPGVVVADADDASLESAQVQITNAKDGDELSYATTNGVNGSVNAARDTVTLTGSGAKADYQAALRAVKFRNTRNDPSLVDRAVSFKVNDGDADSASPTRTISFGARPPVSTAVPTISGPRRIASTLTASTGDWDGTRPIEYGWQWQRCAADGSDCSNITGALAATYVPAAEDAGTRLRMVVTADNPAAGTVAQASDLTAAIRSTIAPPAVGEAPAANSGSPSARLTFSGEDGATFECSLDGADFAACSSPVDVAGLADAAHSFRVRQTYEGVTSVAATHEWAVDTGRPGAPTIIGAPDPETGETAARLEFQLEAGATAECSLDGSAFALCSSPFEATGLALGPHSFRVRQTDLAGNVSDPATRNWRIDVEFEPGEDGTNTRDVDALVNSTVTVEEARVAVGCELNRGSLEVCEVDALVDTSSLETARASKMKLIGRGRTTLDERGHRSAVVDIELNDLGRRLLRKYPRGLKVVFKVEAKPFDSEKSFRTTRRANLRPPVLLVVPSAGIFDGDSAALDAVARRYVRAVARSLTGVKRIRCEGHADGSGSRAYARRIGLRRAKAVCKALRGAGLRVRSSAISYGSTRPRASNRTARGRRLNRRVDVRTWF